MTMEIKGKEDGACEVLMPITKDVIECLLINYL